MRVVPFAVARSVRQQRARPFAFAFALLGAAADLGERVSKPLVRLQYERLPYPHSTTTLY